MNYVKTIRNARMPRSTTTVPLLFLRSFASLPNEQLQLDFVLKLTDHGYK